MTNKLIATAGALSLAFTAVHVFAGGADVHAPMLQSELSPLLKGYASVLWHGVTIGLLACSAMLVIASIRTDLRATLTGLVAAQYLAYAGLFVVYGLSRFGSVFVMPQWIGFLVIIAVALAGRPWQRQNQGFGYGQVETQ